VKGLKGFFKSASPLTLLVMGLAFVYAIGLFNHGLIPSMEPRFAQVISEMIATGEYLIPIKNGIPYVEYPPLLYWLAIVFVKVGLPDEAAIRLPCYISFVVWVLYVSKLQSLLFKDWPAYTMPVLGAALPAVLWHFFTAQTDSLLITGVLIAFVGFVKLRLNLLSGHRFPWELWLGVSLAAAAKGPVGIACTLPVMMLEVLLAGVTMRQVGTKVTDLTIDVMIQLKSFAWVRGLALLSLTMVPWYLASGYYYGWDFVQAVFVYQNVDRYLSGLGGHQRPWWYYFESVLAGLLPVSVFVPAGIWIAAKRLNKLPNRLMLSWAVYTFLFFSLSASKQGKYILPSAPAFLALGIIGIEATSKHSFASSLKWLRVWSVGVIVVWGVLVVFILPVYSGRIANTEGYSVIRETIDNSPGNLVHYQWPRSLTLYELGAPMDYVRSSRELYKKVKNGEINAGDYLLVRESDLPTQSKADRPEILEPAPASPWFEHVLSVKAKNKVQLFRVMPNTSQLDLPPTPEPKELNWRDAKFDTD